MACSEFTFKTGDGLDLFARLWPCPGAPRAVVALVHGLGEHSGRYARLAACLTGRGYALTAMDLRGHGRSQGRKGHAPSYDVLMDDIERFLKQAGRQCPGIPVFLYGHSLGGNLVLNYLLRRKPLLAGAVATSPLLRPASRPPAGKMVLAGILYRLLPAVPLANTIDPAFLSRDPAAVSDYRADPLVYHRVTARLGLDFLAAGQWALAHAAGLAASLLLMHGGADRVTSVDASREFAARAGDRCTLKIWPGLYHELHNEPEKQQVFDFLLEWLGRQ
jgi:alpha-beta hydrolase superfamily lysophospholipase